MEISYCHMRLLTALLANTLGKRVRLSFLVQSKCYQYLHFLSSQD